MLQNILLPIGLLLCAGGFAQKINYVYIKDLPAATEKYAGDFEAVSNQVNRKYTHLQNKNLDGKALQTQYLEEVKNTKTNLEYGQVLLRYFAALGNGHSGPIFKKYYKNCSAVLVEDRIFLSYVGDSVFQANGISEKNEILQVDHIPVLTFIEQQAQYVPASTDLHRRYISVSQLFSSYFEGHRVYTILTSAGEKEVTVHFEEPHQQPQAGSKPASKVDYKILEGNIAYINITAMTGNVVDDFTKAFDSLSAKPYLILDLRRNQGGNSGYSEKITEYLLRQELTACVSKRKLKPRKNAYQGKLFVLTGPYTFSAAESFALDLLESGNAVLVGQPTGGDTGNQPQFYQSPLGYSYWFPSRSKAQVSEKGFPMEGKSIEPHHYVQKTASDFLKGEDTVLNHTLDLVRKKP